MLQRSSISIGALAVAAAMLIASSANAHPTLKSASPVPDMSITGSPTEVRLRFSEGVIAKFSGLELKDEKGAMIPTGTAVIDNKDKRQLIVPLTARLAVGRYTVNWHVVSEDTHRVQGEYSFRVEP
jgi:copper resistance protein C